MIKIDVTLPIKYNRDDLIESSLAVLPISRDEIVDIQILKRTLSLSDNERPRYSASVALEVSSEREAGLLKMRNKVKPYEKESFTAPIVKLDHRPVIVGAGPAGLFAALTLAP